VRSYSKVAIIFDGEAWFVRSIRTIEHDLDLDEKVYRCDTPIGGPFKSISDAVECWAKSVLERTVITAKS
jgi:hypothetical protein